MFVDSLNALKSVHRKTNV